ncbi:MAG: myo-inosose-2 dehydratase [Pseudomonadota bacterium]
MTEGVRLGTNPIGWSNDDMLELGGDIPLETCLAQASAAGFAGIELGNKFPRDATLLRPILEAHGLDLVSGWYSGSLLHGSVDVEWTEMAGHLELLEQMGSKVMVYCDVTDSVHGDPNKSLIARPRIPDDSWRGFCDRLTQLAERMEERGMRMAYHHHMGAIIQTEAETDRLMEETGPEVGLLLDTGHATFAGGDPVAMAKRHAERIVHVHTKDVRNNVMQLALANGSSFLEAVVDGVFTVPGDGDVDIEGALVPLAEEDYRGWLVVEAEQDPEKANPAEYARLGYKNLHALATKVGLLPSDS